MRCMMKYIIKSIRYKGNKMKITSELMEKRITVLTTDGDSLTGLCWGVYGSVQGEEDHGRAERYLELFDGGQSIVIFESEIQSITVE